jgi:hypothetical protein
VHSSPWRVDGSGRAADTPATRQRPPVHVGRTASADTIPALAGSRIAPERAASACSPADDPLCASAGAAAFTSQPWMLLAGPRWCRLAGDAGAARAKLEAHHARAREGQRCQSRIGPTGTTPRSSTPRPTTRALPRAPRFRVRPEQGGAPAAAEPNAVPARPLAAQHEHDCGSRHRLHGGASPSGVPPYLERRRSRFYGGRPLDSMLGRLSAFVRGAMR